MLPNRSNVKALEQPTSASAGSSASRLPLRDRGILDRGSKRQAARNKTTRKVNELPRILAAFCSDTSTKCGRQIEQWRTTMVRITTIAVATALLILPAAAQSKGKSTTSPGQTQTTPGQQQTAPGGAKDFAPGQIQTAPGEAKDLAPGAGQRKTK